MRAGELSQEEAESESRSLGYSPASDEYQVERFPSEAQALIAASEDLYLRLQRISNKILSEARTIPEPHAMIERLRASF